MVPRQLTTPWVPAVLLTAVLLAGAYTLWQWQQINVWNARMQKGDLLSLPEAGMPVEALMVRAAQLDAKGNFEGALSLYKRLEERADNPYGNDAAYNAATLYLRRATELGGPEADPQAVPLVELSKEGLRSLLRRSPGDWDARYNLDRALRLSPEEDDDSDGGQPPLNAERAPTTMRGFTLGLP